MGPAPSDPKPGPNWDWIHGRYRYSMNKTSHWLNGTGFTGRYNQESHIKVLGGSHLGIFFVFWTVSCMGPVLWHSPPIERFGTVSHGRNAPLFHGTPIERNRPRTVEGCEIRFLHHRSEKLWLSDSIPSNGQTNHQTFYGFNHANLFLVGVSDFVPNHREIWKFQGHPFWARSPSSALSDPCLVGRVPNY